MAAEIIFRDIERTPELERYLTAQTEELIADFFDVEHSPSLRITVYEDRHRPNPTHNHYVCDLLFRGDSQNFKVSKSSFDLYDCVSEAGIALRKKVRRNHKYQISQRRQKPSSRAGTKPVDDDVAA